VRELTLAQLPAGLSPGDATFIACLATILELEPSELDPLAGLAHAPGNPSLTRWLAGRGLGLVQIADAAPFAWPGPWIALAVDPAAQEWRAVVMYGVPSGIAYDPSRLGSPARPPGEPAAILAGFVVAATDIALATPARPAAPVSAGTVISIHVAPGAGEPVSTLERALARAGHGLEGDRHTTGRGTFPSDAPGSALTLIDSDVCHSLSLQADEHRRNVVSAGIDLNALVGHDFLVGNVRCRGMRLCEPCTVLERYAGRPVLRALAHRGGLRADVLVDGTIAVGDRIEAVSSPVPPVS